MAPSTQAGGKAEAEAEAAVAPSAGDGQQGAPCKPVNWFSATRARSGGWSGSP